MTKYKNSPARYPFFYGYVIVALSFTILAVTIGTYYSFGVFFKPMAQDFGWSRAVTSGAFSISWIVTGLFAIVLGGLNDHFGPRLVMSICGLFAGAGFLLMSQVNSLWNFYLIYGVIIGIGISVFIPLLSTVARWFVGRRTLMYGIVVCGIGLGGLIIPPIANHLIELFDWRICFIILGSIILIINLTASQFLINYPSQIGQQAYGEKTLSLETTGFTLKSFSLKQAVITRQFWIILVMFFSFGFCFNAL